MPLRAAGGSGGGTSDYGELENKPSINGVTLEGNRTAEELGLATAGDLAEVAGDVEAVAGDLATATAAIAKAVTDAETATDNANAAAAAAESAASAAEVASGKVAAVSITVDYQTGATLGHVVNMYGQDIHVESISALNVATLLLTVGSEAQQEIPLTDGKATVDITIPSGEQMVAEITRTLDGVAAVAIGGNKIFDV